MSREPDGTLGMLTAIKRRLVERFRFSERHAAEIAGEAMEALSEHVGGERVYIRKLGPQHLPEPEQLAAEYDGTAPSRHSLMKKHGLSTSQFYRQLAKVKDGK